MAVGMVAAGPPRCNGNQSGHSDEAAGILLGLLLLVKLSSLFPYFLVNTLSAILNKDKVNRYL